MRNDTTFKVKLLLGLVFIGLAFVGTVAVVYVLTRDINRRSLEAEEWKGRAEVLAEEKGLVEEQNAELSSQVGEAINLDRVVQQAEQFYSQDVKEARAGTLWVDRTSDIWIVTLGAVHGLEEGSTLAIYDGEDRIDTVKVDLPLDVVSYVKPLPELKKQFKQDYFRVVIE